MFLIADDYWQIKRIKEKGLGVFAKKNIKAGIIIGDYLGKVIKTYFGWKGSVTAAHTDKATKILISYLEDLTGLVGK